MEREGTVTIEYVVNVCEVGKVVVHTFHRHHSLTVLVDGEGMVFHRLCSHIYLWQEFYLCQYRVVRSNGLALYGHYLQLRVEVGKQRSHEVMETVEHAQHDDKGHGGHCHTYHRDDTDDIDDMRTLLGEEVPACYKEREIHLASFLPFYPFTFSRVRRYAPDNRGCRPGRSAVRG